MGSLSVSTHRGLVYWQGLLLVVSLLTWSPPTTAKIGIASTFATEGKSALLRIHYKPPEVLGYLWYKGNGVDYDNLIASLMLRPSFYSSDYEYNQRARVLADGSLVLKNVTMKDTGPYTVMVYLPASETDTGTGLLQVYEYLSGPFLTTSSYWAIENDDEVVLTCYSNAPIVQWLFNDVSLSFTYRMKLTADGRILTINPVKREDAGVYKCMGTNPIMRVKSQPIALYVYYD